MNNALVHDPVLLNEAIKYLAVKPNGTYIDCTLGRGGHSEAILKLLTTGKLYAFDQDQNAIIESNIKLKNYQGKYKIIASNFVNVQQMLKQFNITEVDGILYDLGVSSPQLDEDIRGFSYQKNSKLDMRMNLEQTWSAWDLVNKSSYQELKKIIKEYGEEPFAGQIARNICQKQAKGEIINTTEDLVTIIKKSIPIKILNTRKHHPAKKTFQALRIMVNNELENFQKSLTQALRMLKSNGRLVVISFHSLEDRIVKNTFQKIVTDPNDQFFAKIPLISNWKPEYQILTKKPIMATSDEVNKNPRSRSAKMRVIKKY